MFVNQTYKTINAAQWNRDFSSHGHTVYSRLNGETGRKEIVCVNGSGQVVAQASWGVEGREYQRGKKLFGDRLESAGLPRWGY